MTHTDRDNEIEWEEEGNASLRRERLIMAGALFIFALFGMFAVYDDWLENVSLTHLIIEGAMNLIALAGAAYLLLRLARSKRQSISALRSRYVKARSAAATFQMHIEKFREGISGAITQQLKAWKLTPSEEEICLLLLKGFSLQEIADLRATSERTSRQQASMLYKKTGLSGRAQLSAFFLEDLLTVSPEVFKRSTKVIGTAAMEG